MPVFDTHTYIKELKTAGFTEEQAEVQARTLQNIIDSDLASKQSLKELEVALQHEIALVRRDIKEQETKTEIQLKELEAKMEIRFKELELRLTLRLGGMLVLGIGAVATLIKLL